MKQKGEVRTHKKYSFLDTIPNLPYFKGDKKNLKLPDLDPRYYHVTKI